MQMPRFILRIFTIVVGVGIVIHPTLRAQSCPPGTVHVGNQEERTADAIIIHPICQQLSPNNISKDPDAARLSAIQLQLVNHRIAYLQKAIALLGDSNPEWARERDRLLEDRHEDVMGACSEAVNLMSLGLAEWAKEAAKLHLDNSQINYLMRAFQEPLANLPSDEAKLNRILATTSDPALTKAILEYEADLHQLRSAAASKDVVDMAARTRDAVEVLHSESEIMQLKPPQSASAANALYVSSATVGSVAIIFVADGPQSVAAAIGSAGSSILVGGREAVNLWQEHKELAALDQQASDRNRMRVELTGRLNDLQQQRDRLTWAVQHAGGTE